MQRTLTPPTTGVPPTASEERSDRATARGRRRLAVDRRARYRAFRRAIRPSPHCARFIGRLDALEARVDRAQARLEALEERLRAARADAEGGDFATVAINRWFVEQRLDVVDAEAVRKARRLRAAMAGVEGLPEDPVAALAQLAGADIYVMHNAQARRAGGGYQVHVDVRAYEVVSGKLLASKVGRSARMAAAERENATAEAVGRAMPRVLRQMMAYWSDMTREGVRSRIVVRGRLGASRLRRRVARALRDLEEVIGPRRCGGRCAWERSLVTAATIAGDYVAPARVRRELGDYLEEALERAGLRVRLVVSNPALTIVEVR